MHKATKLGFAVLAALSIENYGTATGNADEAKRLAAEKPVVAWTGELIGVDNAVLRGQAAPHVRTQLFVPLKESHCEFVSAGSPAETARLLVEKLAAAKLI